MLCPNVTEKLTHLIRHDLFLASNTAQFYSYIYFNFIVFKAVLLPKLNFLAT